MSGYLATYPGLRLMSYTSKTTPSIVSLLISDASGIIP